MTELAIAELARAVRGREDVFAVHYACESFYEALDHPPGVSAIAVSTVPRGTSRTFSRIDSANPDTSEIQLLEAFFGWLRSRPDARLIHWNMNSSEFGFSALENRYAYLGGTAPATHAVERTFPLGDLIALRHGANYVGHPRLTRLLGLNGVTTRYSLSGAEQARKFNEGAHADLARCTSERATSIASVAELFVNGRLQTERSGPAVHFAGAMIDSVDVVLAIGGRLHEVARELGHRHGGRPAHAMADEYDYQDLLRAQLRLFFDDVRPEDHGPVVAGAASRIDFVLPEFGIAVEVKVARATLNAGQLGGELVIDARRYEAHPSVRHMVCLVFDPTGFIQNPRGVENDLSGMHDGLAVTVKIFA
jgi:hypothetical protein